MFTFVIYIYVGHATWDAPDELASHRLAYLLRPMHVNCFPYRVPVLSLFRHVEYILLA